MGNAYQVFPQLSANVANIPQGVFISLDPNNDFGAVVSTVSGGANSAVIGVSTIALSKAAGFSTNDNVAAYYQTPAGTVVKETVEYFGLGSVAQVLLATGGSGCTRGQFLGPNTDGSGQAISVTASGSAFGGLALQNGAAGGFVAIFVTPGFHS